MNTIQLNPDVVLYDHFVFLTNHKVLILGDLHFGYEEALHQQGVLIPKTNFRLLTEKVTRALDVFKPRSIILNGDVLHEFGSIPRGVWGNVEHFLRFLLTYGNVIIVRGNHDTMIMPIAEQLGIAVCREYCSADKKILVTHGDIFHTSARHKKTEMIIVGHEHPAVSLHDGVRTETYKCFLVGHLEKSLLIVMPSFNFLNGGIDFSLEGPIGPYLKKVVMGRMKVFVIEDEIYAFGTLSKLQKQYS
jgi:uncharacterized protein